MNVRRLSLLGALALLIALSGCQDPAVEQARQTAPSEDSAGGSGRQHDAASQPRQGSDPKAFGKVEYSEQRARCANSDPLRVALFGDLHVHTAYSFDSYGNGTRTKPDDAYRFARGEPIPVPPYDGNNQPIGHVRIHEPLDFMAVTDHSEYFGEMALCLTPGNAAYDLPICRDLRKPGPESYVALATSTVMQSAQRNPQLCGADNARCENQISVFWNDTVAAAERAYDRSDACKFTTFVGYEYSAQTLYRNMHRNVIFRNAAVPAKPVSYIEAPRAHELWEQLQRKCIDGIAGCDVLAIPHNPNLSNGALLGRIETGNIEEDRRLATLRQATEPLMEIFQHKGNSECMNGLWGVLGEPDELCNMEQVRHIGSYTSYKNVFVETVDCKQDAGHGFFGLFAGGCVASNDFFRGASLLGLKEQQRLGVNPIKMGVIASTDTHVGAAGATAESTWEGHIAYETDPQARLGGSPYLPTNRNGNPGGLAGVWAVENSRDAIFDALKRRETFGTSGTRIRPRFFGGWEYDQALCNNPSAIEIAYAQGVPMGGDLTGAARESKPRFLVMAQRDPAASGLKKLQVIKGWIDAKGQARYAVHDVAGTSDSGRTGDLRESRKGHDSLCAVFVDMQFDPDVPSFYYMRAVEVPTPRWSASLCARLPEGKRPAFCSDPQANTMINELAWTSPIWYQR